MARSADIERIVEAVNAEAEPARAREASSHCEADAVRPPLRGDQWMRQECSHPFRGRSASPAIAHVLRRDSRSMDRAHVARSPWRIRVDDQAAFAFPRPSGSRAHARIAKLAVSGLSTPPCARPADFLASEANTSSNSRRAPRSLVDFASVAEASSPPPLRLLSRSQATTLSSYGNSSGSGIVASFALTWARPFLNHSAMECASVPPRRQRSIQKRVVADQRAV